MAYIYTKGWYVKELKKNGIRNVKGKKLESLKTHVLASEYAKLPIT